MSAHEVGMPDEELLQLLRFISGEAGPQLPRMPRLGMTPCVGRAPMWDDRVDGETPEERVRRLEAARNVCRRCPVRLACDAEAHASPYTEGVWAGFFHLEEPIYEEVAVTDPQPLPF